MFKFTKANRFLSTLLTIAGVGNCGGGLNLQQKADVIRGSHAPLLELEVETGSQEGQEMRFRQVPIQSCVSFLLNEVGLLQKAGPVSVLQPFMITSQQSLGVCGMVLQPIKAISEGA